MYKPVDKLQHSFLDFNQPLGLKMNPENRWIRLADSIPWDELERKYADLFPSDTGNVAKPLRMALGSLIIQKKFQFSDRELVEQITENPYLQYFIGLPGYQDEPPFDSSTLVLFRKRLDVDAIMDANAYMFDSKKDDNHTPPSDPFSDGSSSALDKTDPGTKENQGTLIVDATCAPANIHRISRFSTKRGRNWKASFSAFVKLMASHFPDGMPGKHGKITLLMQNAGSIPGNRQGRQLKSSFPMSAVTWIMWIVLCQRDTLL